MQLVTKTRKVQLYKNIGVPGAPLVHAQIQPKDRKNYKYLEELSDVLKKIYETFDKSLDQIPDEWLGKAVFNIVLAADFGPEEIDAPDYRASDVIVPVDEPR